MSSNSAVPQCYSLDNTGSRYAINERPLDNGVVGLGYYAGSAGSYCIALANPALNSIESIILTDKSLQTQTDLIRQTYSFTSEKGTFDNRFELKVAQTPTFLDEEKAEQTRITTENGLLRIHTHIGNKVTLYSLNGIKLKEFITESEDTSIPASKGVYLVKVNDTTYKSVVF
jgi:hypothetical protein